MKLNENDENYSVHITATGILTDNPKSLAAMERTMHHREGDLRSVSSTADHPTDEKICGIKRSNPPPDWPSSVCSTRSLPSTVTTGVTPQEETMSCLTQVVCTGSDPVINKMSTDDVSQA